jgi:hypothetical protein
MTESAELAPYPATTGRHLINDRIRPSRMTRNPAASREPDKRASRSTCCACRRTPRSRLPRRPERRECAPCPSQGLITQREAKCSAWDPYRRIGIWAAAMPGVADGAQIIRSGLAGFSPFARWARGVIGWLMRA